MGFAEELLANPVMGKIVRKGAVQIQAELAVAAKQLCDNNGWLFDAPSVTKGEKRATEKVAEKYAGDWLQIKDMSRCTIVISNPLTIHMDLKKIQNYFCASNGWGYVETKYPKGDEDPCGYSDWKVIVKRKGYMAEVQINTKSMIFAKSLKSFRKICNLKEEGEMKAKYGVPGGLGHQIFVEWRGDKVSPRAKKLAALSTSYYDYFRSNHPSPIKKIALLVAIRMANLNPAHG